jgi:hypothetical protein
LKHDWRKGLWAAVFLILTSACASLKVEKDKVADVKRVAIIGFGVQQQSPVSMGDLFKVATHQNTASKAEVKGRTESDHVAKMYDNLKQKLEQQNHWKVMSQDQLKSNPAYLALFKAKTEGWQNRPIMNDRYVFMQPAGILDNFAVMTTEAEILKKLQEDLKVDAVLVVSINVDLNNNSMFASMVGQGKFSPSANTNLYLLDAKTENKIWIDPGTKGDEIENSDKNFMGLADQERLNKLAVLAADSSYSKILANYAEKLSK